MPHKPRTFLVIRPDGTLRFGFRCCTVSKWARDNTDRRKLIRAHTKEQTA